jgi:hypothetical protein
MHTTALAAMIAGVATGCVAGAGPTLSVRMNGDVRFGLDGQYLAQVNDGPTPELAGAGVGFATTVEGSNGTTVYGYLAGTATVAPGANASASLALGIATPVGARASRDAIGGYMAVSGGAMSGVACSGLAGSVELGFRWNGGPEFFVAARGNYVVRNDTASCGSVGLNDR